LTPDDLLTLEAYARLRPAFRQRVMEHKRHRRVMLGDNVMLVFEDRLTMHYQVQEMLRAERLFEEAEIREELAAYNPLIPDGTNWKATMMIEFPDESERRLALARLVGVEDRVWVAVGDTDPVFAVADEDLERSTAEKTSSVHFLRFELSESAIALLKSGARLSVGIDHPEYRVHTEAVSSEMRESLIADLD
jgi:hypothetical protein